MRNEHVVLETDRYRIEGSLTLPREGYRSRLSDHVNQPDREFFSLVDARLTTLDSPRAVENVGFVLVARRHVRFVVPGGEFPGSGPSS